MSQETCLLYLEDQTLSFANFKFSLEASFQIRHNGPRDDVVSDCGFVRPSLKLSLAVSSVLRITSEQCCRPTQYNYQKPLLQHDT